MQSKDRLAALLADQVTPAMFSSRRTASPDCLKIDVRGVGPLVMPVAAEQAKALCAIAEPAKYGLGERTLTDVRVRDTWQVPTELVSIDPTWDATLLSMVRALATDLGLPEDADVRAELHSFLVYEPGQFFAPHQDSEKHDDMIASLVVMLPTTARGGELVIEHRGEKATHRASSKELTFVAFYPDCRHEVRPLRAGHRVALTYNIMLSGSPAPSVPRQSSVAAVHGCLDEHFADGVDRLVYLLDHQYTQHSLRLDRLKGVDRSRVDVLRAAAAHADGEVVLGLVEVRETWNAWRLERPYGSWYDEIDDDPDDAGDVELTDLLDRNVRLVHVTALDGSATQALAELVTDDEVAASTPNNAMTPFDSQYEGYMGNYGNTMDRWYRRGAVVVWPRHAAFRVHAEAAPDRALTEIARAARDEGVERARELAASLLPRWQQIADDPYVPGGRSRASIAAASAAAAALDAPDCARQLLAPFRLVELRSDDAAIMATLTAMYGDAWMHAVVTSWSSDCWDSDLLLWLARLDVVIAKLLRRSAGGPEAARIITDASSIGLRRVVARRAAIERPSARHDAMAALVEPLVAVLRCTTLCGADDIAKDVGRVLRRHGAAAPRLVVRTLRRCDDVDVRFAGVDQLARHVVKQLRARLEQPARAQGDWSLVLPAGCRCADCRTLADFLASPDQQVQPWPLAEQRRRHVHERLDRHELPVTHRTRRTGRPHTLVLTKRASLFDEEAQARAADSTDLAWLEDYLDRAKPRARRRTH